MEGERRRAKTATSKHKVKGEGQMTSKRGQGKLATRRLHDELAFSRLSRIRRKHTADNIVINNNIYIYIYMNISDSPEAREGESACWNLGLRNSSGDKLFLVTLPCGWLC